MTRKALVEREKKRKDVRLKYSSKRVHIKDELQKLQKDPSNNFDAIQELYSQLQSLPRNASPVRERRRCRLTGRPRGVYRKVELCRNMFRIYAMKGQIPGITKASW